MWMSPLSDTSSPAPPLAQGTNRVTSMWFTSCWVDVAAARLGAPAAAGAVASSPQPREESAKAPAMRSMARGLRDECRIGILLGSLDDEGPGRSRHVRIGVVVGPGAGKGHGDDGRVRV